MYTIIDKIKINKCNRYVLKQSETRIHKQRVSTKWKAKDLGYEEEEYN